MAYYTIDATKPSPNHSSRNGAAIRMLVIHATAGSGPSALAELRDPKPQTPMKRVSAHYLIYKTGYIYQLVPDALAAWHAGASAWLDMNAVEIMEGSIGIELENANTGTDPYPPAQLGALTWLSKILVGQYQIAPAFVVRHSDIAVPKGRKTDPVGFPWAQFRSDLYGVPASAPTTKRYRVKRRYVTQRSEDNGPPLVRELIPGEELVIGKWYTNNRAWLADGSGFVDLADLEPIP